jgi:translation elongation factor EF-Tu-like GTPase
MSEFVVDRLWIIEGRGGPIATGRITAGAIMFGDELSIDRGDGRQDVVTVIGMDHGPQLDSIGLVLRGDAASHIQPGDVLRGAG